MATAKERLDKHDREIAAIRQLIRSGMRMLIQNQQLLLEYERKTEEKFQSLADAQAKTEKSLQAFIDSLSRGGNGHVKSNKIT